MFTSTLRFAVLLSALVGASASHKKVPVQVAAPAPLCSANTYKTVECCEGTVLSDSETAANLFAAFGATPPTSVVDVGFNCSPVTDDEVTEGQCGEFVFCCNDLYTGTDNTEFDSYDGTFNGTSFYGTLASGCSDVPIVP